jgi:uncharacterized protein YggE
MTRPLEASNRSLPFTLAALALAACAACAAPVQAATSPAVDPAHRRVLTVVGTATVDLVPDCLDVSMALSTDGNRPKAAMSALRAKQDVLVKALVAAGVAPGEVKLSGLTVSPTTDALGRVTGYRAAIRVVASTRKLELVGELMEAATTAGTQSMSTSYRVSDLASFKKKARQMALTAAAEKAHDIAGALDTHLGHVAEVSESAGDWNPGGFGNAYVASPSGGAQLGPESQPLTLSVNVVYELE